MGIIVNKGDNERTRHISVLARSHRIMDDWKNFDHKDLPITTKALGFISYRPSRLQ